MKVDGALIASAVRLTVVASFERDAWLFRRVMIASTTIKTEIQRTEDLKRPS